MKTDRKIMKRVVRDKNEIPPLKPKDKEMVSKGTLEALAFIKRQAAFEARSRKCNPKVG